MICDEVFISCFDISFVPLRDIVMPRFTGVISLSSLLALFSRVDWSLAKVLHESKVIKPYSCTPIYPEGGSPSLSSRGSITHLKRGYRYHIRFTLITNNVAKMFLRAITKVSESSNGSWDLSFMDVRCPIMEISVQVLTYKDITPSVEDEYVKVRFLTPTRFSVRSTVRRPKPKFRLFPVPENLFHSLVHHWNTFAPDNCKINEEVLYEYVLNYVTEVDYRIARESVEIGKGRKAIGFTGYCAYHFQLCDDPMFKACMKLLSYGELVNVGNAKSMGLGVIKVEPFVRKGSGFEKHENSTVQWTYKMVIWKSWRKLKI